MTTETTDPLLEAVMDAADDFYDNPHTRERLRLHVRLAKLQWKLEVVNQLSTYSGTFLKDSFTHQIAALEALLEQGDTRLQED